MSKIDYRVGRSNLSCTVFAPYDCKNNCPFCTSKPMYRTEAFRANIPLMIEQIKKINNVPFIKEFVITGGEPFANLKLLKDLIDAMEKTVYINTTLPTSPTSENIDEVINFINSNPKIGGVNISRHLSFDFPNVASLEDIEKITKPVRINTVIPEKLGGMAFDEFFGKFKEFVKKYGSPTRMINLRANYKHMKHLFLRVFDRFERELSKEYIYKGSGGCMVCYSTLFEADNCMIQYHRGMESSRMALSDEVVYFNDVLLTPNGHVYSNWSFSTDDDFLAFLFNERNTEGQIISSEVIDDESGYATTVYVKEEEGDDIVLTVDRNKAKTFYNTWQIDRIKKELENKLL